MKWFLCLNNKPEQRQRWEDGNFPAGKAIKDVGEGQAGRRRWHRDEFSAEWLTAKQTTGWKSEEMMILFYIFRRPAAGVLPPWMLSALYPIH
jgi:hypothetical protein